MPFSLGNLANTVVRGRTAIGRGRIQGEDESRQMAADEEDRRRRVENDILSRELMQARTQKLLAPPVQRPTKTLDQIQAEARARATGTRQGRGATGGRSGAGSTVTAPRPGSPGERVAVGVESVRDIVKEARDILTTDNDASRTPSLAIGAGAVVERLLGRGPQAEEASGAARRSLQSDAQNTYQSLRDRFKHSFATLYPRVSIALMNNLADAYWRMPGESAELGRRKYDALVRLLDIVDRVRGRPDEAQVVASALPPEFRAQFLAELGTASAPSPSAPSAPPATTPAARPNRFLNRGTP